MSAPFSFKLLANDGQARLGRSQRHAASFEPPLLLVGTAATVKAVYLDAVKSAGADVILGNTYHLMLRPARSGWRGLAACTDSWAGKVRSLPIPVAIK